MNYLEQVEAIVKGPVECVTGVEDVDYVFVVRLKDRSVGYQGTIAKFRLQQLPGCCGVLVSYHANVKLAWRCKGLGTILNKMRQQIAWNKGYTLLLCTDVMENDPQQKILERNGWVPVTEFKNRRTDNEVGLYLNHLADSGVAVGQPDLDYAELEED